MRSPGTRGLLHSRWADRRCGCNRQLERRVVLRPQATSDQMQDLEHLAGVIAEVGIHALEANDAAAVDDHEAHLGYAAHHAHWFVWLGKHVVGTGDLEVSVEKNGQ